MKFGLSFLPDATPETKSARVYYAEAMELAVMADRAGMCYVKMTEHYLKGYGGYCPSPLLFLSHVAARTKRVRLMTGGILPTFHHPVQTAAECSLLDVLSGGRLDAGFARAWMPYEFECFGVPIDESYDRFRKSVETIIRLWTEESVTLSTPYFSFADAHSLPSPLQKPHPPVHIAAVRSRKSFAWIGEKGFKLMVTSSLISNESLADYIRIYRESYEENRRPGAEPPEVILSVPFYLAPTDKEARQRGDRHLTKYLQSWGEAAAAWTKIHSKDYPGYGGFMNALARVTPEKSRTGGEVIIGSPERAIDVIHQFREKLNVDNFMWQVEIGSMPGEESKRSLRLFIDEVAPHL